MLCAHTISRPHRFHVDLCSCLCGGMWSRGSPDFFSVCRRFFQLTWWWICRVFLVFFFRFPRTFFCCRCAYLTLYARGEPLSVHASRVVVRRKEACARGVFNPPLSSLGILTFLIQRRFSVHRLCGAARRRQFLGAPGRVWTSTPCCSCSRVA